jgi:hypothetical protein
MIKIGNIELPDFPYTFSTYGDVWVIRLFVDCVKCMGLTWCILSLFHQKVNSWCDQKPMKLDIFDYERRIQIFGGDEEAMAYFRQKSFQR